MVESIHTTPSVPRTPSGFSSRVLEVWKRGRASMQKSPSAKGFCPSRPFSFQPPPHEYTATSSSAFHLEALLRLRQIQSGELEAALIELTTGQGVMLGNSP